MANEIIPIEAIENKIFVIRGQKVMLDSDLAMLYEVPTKRLNEAAKRNKERFPQDFMFQLTNEEWHSLRSQFATSNIKGGRRYNPYVFSEHGVLMLSNILKSQRAIATSIQIVRVFVRIREMVLSHKELSQKLNELEYKFLTQNKENNKQFFELFRAIKQLSKEDEKPNTIGFVTD